MSNLWIEKKAYLKVNVYCVYQNSISIKLCIHTPKIHTVLMPFDLWYVTGVLFLNELWLVVCNPFYILPRVLKSKHYRAYCFFVQLWCICQINYGNYTIALLLHISLPASFRNGNTS